MTDYWNRGDEPIEVDYQVIDERDAGESQPGGGTGHIEMDPHPPYITYVILAVNVAAWAIMTLFGLVTGLSQSQQLLVFGAKVNVLIAHGQYWRLLTAMFLHIGIMHLFFNSYALFIYGPIVEKLFGKARFSIVYLLSGLMGSLFSYVFSPNPAAGASGAIFGLMGSLLYFRQRRRYIFKRVFGPGLLIIIGINLFYGFVQPGIDNWGHIGGLLGGFLIGNAAGMYKENRFDYKRLFLWILIISLFLVGLYYGHSIHRISVL